MQNKNFINLWLSIMAFYFYQAKQTKSESKTSAPASTIKLVSQAARQNKQVVTKSVPRPKGNYKEYTQLR